MVDGVANTLASAIRPLGTIGTVVDVSEIADAIVRGACIIDATILDLRTPIEAVQQHPDAKLARAAEMSRDEMRALTCLRLNGCEIARCDLRHLKIHIQLEVTSRIIAPVLCYDTAFLALADFSSSIFVGEAEFGMARFDWYALFHDCSFEANADFGCTEFLMGAAFTNARFKSNVSFASCALVGHTSFVETEFNGVIEFDECLIARGPCRFDDAKFKGTFGSLRLLVSYCCEMRIDARLLDVRQIHLGPADGLLQAVLTKYEGVRRSQRQPTKWRVRRAFLSALRRCKDTVSGFTSHSFGWTTVRGVGQLSILTRVSIVALIAVPLIAWAWPAIQYAFQVMAKPIPDLGASLALAFFASVLVTVGQVLYQIHAPERIRKQDEDSFVEWMQQRYGEDCADRDDGLRRATDSLAAIARCRIDRNANFVRHHGQTVWIPPSDRIDWFRDPVAEVDEYHVGESLPAVPTEGGPIPLPSGTITGAERARIALEEGARAEYWITGRRSLAWAWGAFFAYGGAVLVLLWILVIQCWQVGHVAGWGVSGIYALVALGTTLPLTALTLGYANRERDRGQ